MSESTKEALEQALTIVNSAQHGRNLDAYLALPAMLEAAIPVAELEGQAVELLINYARAFPDAKIHIPGTEHITQKLLIKWRALK